MEKYGLSSYKNNSLHSRITVECSETSSYRVPWQAVSNTFKIHTMRHILVSILYLRDTKVGVFIP